MKNPAPIKHDGNQNLFLAVEMSLISTLAGIPLHLHAEGLRGTGKTTVMRWARDLTPPIQRIKGCLYHCDPERPHCPLHSSSSDTFEREYVPMPFVEIGHGAKLGTILGSIDLARLTDPRRPEAALLPGALTMANRGIVFVDEVNRLAETAPEITDVLLSVMGTKPGRIKIEEVGLMPCEIDVTCSVWAASNPDEEPGPLEEIRRQLADRFDLVVAVQRPSDPAVVERILRREVQEEMLSAGFSQLEKHAMLLKDVRVPGQIVRYLAQLYVQRNIESLRAIEALELSSRIAAAMRGRDEVTFDELLAVIPMVLRHRVEPLVLSEILKDLELRKAAGSSLKSPHRDGQNRLPPEETGDNLRYPDNPGASGLRTPPAEEQNLLRPAAHQASNARPSCQGHNSSGRTGSPASQNSGAECTSRNYFPALPAQQNFSVWNWLRRILGRTPAGPAPSTRTADKGVAQSPLTGHFENGVAAPALADPQTLKPVSPTSVARRLDSLSWEEAVLPPEWKDAWQ